MIVGKSVLDYGCGMGDQADPSIVMMAPGAMKTAVTAAELIE
jgi:hypothetical protein